MFKKKLFNKHNSTKFVLRTDDRDEDGKKIKINTLVPVDYVPGNPSIIAEIESLYPKSKGDDEKYEPKIPRTRKVTGSRASKAPNLENILDQMEVISDEDEEAEDDDLSDVEEKLKTMNFFNTLGSYDYSYGLKVEVDEGSDVSEELGQFSDVESNFDFTDLPRSTLTSKKENCPENIKMLNDGFDKVLEEYDDDQIGGLSDEEICGVFSTENEHIQNFIQTPLRKDIELDEFTEDLKEKTLRFIEGEEEEKIVEVAIKKPIEFDCESIISTYSNQYNHPAIIREPSKIKKIQVSNNPLHKSLTKSKLKQLESVSESDEESDGVSEATSFNVRNKTETPEEKRERKRLFKEAKRESRVLKKENKIAFKDEKKKQVVQAINARNNKGMRLI